MFETVDVQQAQYTKTFRMLIQVNLCLFPGCTKESSSENRLNVKRKERKHPKLISMTAMKSIAN